MDLDRTVAACSTPLDYLISFLEKSKRFFCVILRYFCPMCDCRFLEGTGETVNDIFMCSSCADYAYICEKCGDVFIVNLRSGYSSFCQKCRRTIFGKPLFLRNRFTILMQDGFTCRYCGRSPLDDKTVKLEIDHIKPRVKGGVDALENLVTSCAECNNGKKDILLEKRWIHRIQKRRLYPPTEIPQGFQMSPLNSENNIFISDNIFIRIRQAIKLVFFRRI